MRTNLWRERSIVLVGKTPMRQRKKKMYDELCSLVGKYAEMAKKIGVILS